MRYELIIEGMMCEHCEATVKKALESVPGIVSAWADHRTGKAMAEAERPVDEDAMAKAVEAEDYRVTGLSRAS